MIGIDITHPDFEGRASFGASYVGKGAKKQVKDDNGHGTHVAGIVGGKTYGVAKNVHIIAVKCLDGNGAGTSFMIGQAIRFVIREAKKTGRPSIINMSLGTENDDYIDKAANQAIDAGIYIVAAAGKLNLSLFFNFEGNEKEDGCASSPAKVERVLSVGASTNQDKMAPFSNFGPCVDLFAPGVGIESTYKGGMTESLSGTSMASPMVAGALAVLVSETKAKSREEGQAQFLSILTKNRLKLIKNTANLLLFSSNENVIDMSDGNKGIQAPKKPRKPKTPQVPTSRSIEGSKMHYNLRSKSKTLRKPLTGGRRKQCVDMDIESNDDKMEIVNDYESNLDAQDLCA